MTRVCLRLIQGHVNKICDILMYTQKWLNYTVSASDHHGFNWITFCGGGRNITTEHYLPVSLHMKSNDLSKKAFLNFDNQTFDRLWMDSIHRHNHLFTSETATLPDIIVCKRKFTKEWNRKRNTTELILLLTSSSCVGTRHAISFSTICFSFNHCRKESKNESTLGQISFSEKICKLSYVWCTIKSILQDLIKMSLSNLNEWTWKLDLS